MNAFHKTVVWTSLLFLAKGVEAQTSDNVPVIQITQEGSSVRFAVGFRLHRRNIRQVGRDHLVSVYGC
jgi:hypothetical protein